jgi:Ca2+-binding EF-hand superfamily protein
LIARYDKPINTLDEMIEALKQFSSDGEDKLKITVDQFKYAMTSMGEKMLEHEVEEILTDSDLVFEDNLVIEEFAKYLMSR